MARATLASSGCASRWAWSSTLSSTRCHDLAGSVFGLWPVKSSQIVPRRRKFVPPVGEGGERALARAAPSPAPGRAGGVCHFLAELADPPARINPSENGAFVLLPGGVCQFAAPTGGAARPDSGTPTDTTCRLACDALLCRGNSEVQQGSLPAAATPEKGLTEALAGA